ncbi:MAG: type 1 fimbrial protein [Neisseriaceae bacterium]|nr:type 1 fimbrial protein [Neisseriaceae bacterium]
MNMRWILLCGAWGLLSPVQADAIWDENPLELIGSKVNFKGTVIKPACELEVSSEKQIVQLREVDVKMLYQTGEGLKQPFSIRLANCDVSVVNDVSVMFTGPEDGELPGRLRVNGADDVAIALFAQENSDELLPLGEWTQAQALHAGGNVLQFSARIEGHPSAVQAKNIKTGSFQAITNFTLEYR